LKLDDINKTGRNIEKNKVKNVLWNSEGTLLAVVTASSFFILRINERILKKKIGSEDGDDLEGNDAFFFGFFFFSFFIFFLIFNLYIYL
jgi:hypothetical protein